MWACRAAHRCTAHRAPSGLQDRGKESWTRDRPACSRRRNARGSSSLRKPRSFQACPSWSARRVSNGIWQADENTQSRGKVKSLRGRGYRARLDRLGLEDRAQWSIESQCHQAREGAYAGAHQKELRLIHLAKIASDVALQEVADEAGDEPKSHHHREYLGRRDASYQSESDRRQVQLADGDHYEKEEEPQPTRVSRRSRDVRGRCHHKVRSGKHEIA